jgi:hypothetical protein
MNYYSEIKTFLTIWALLRIAHTSKELVDNYHIAVYVHILSWVISWVYNHYNIISLEPLSSCPVYIAMHVIHNQWVNPYHVYIHFSYSIHIYCNWKLLNLLLIQHEYLWRIKQRKASNWKPDWPSCHFR